MKWLPRAKLGACYSLAKQPSAIIGFLQGMGLECCHLQTPPSSAMTAQHAISTGVAFQQAGLSIDLLFVVFDNENYDTLEAAFATGGFIPAQFRQERLGLALRAVNYANSLRASYLGLHLGPIPSNRDHELYKALATALRSIADEAAASGLGVNLESGESSAQAMADFLSDLNLPNVGVNFDPANMLLYGTGSPTTSLQVLLPWVRSIHCKDALASNMPGITWGREVPLGHGEVDFNALFKILHEGQYEGNLVIERETEEPEKSHDIIHAKRVIEQLLVRDDV